MIPQARCSAGALALACAFTPGVASAQSGPPDVEAEGRAHLDGASAGAEIRAGGAGSPFVPITAATVLPARFELRTAAAPLRLVLADGTRLELAPGTRLSRLVSVDLALPGAGKVAADHLDVVTGEVVVEVPAAARAGATLLSSHDVLVATLPSTVLRVRARAPHGAPKGAPPVALGLAVYQGEARFLTQGAWKLLRAGQVVEAIAHVPAVAPGALPGAPQWSPGKGACAMASATKAAGDCSIALALSRDAAPLSLGWAETPGAVGYRLEIARDAAFREVLEARETGARAATLPLAVGRYFARVVAHGADGMPGPASATRELRVARVDLPGGTGTPAGAWLLPRARSVEVADPTGLELGFGHVGFARLPERFGLADEEPVHAQLRITGAPDFVALTLKPSPLHAAVTMSPRNPIWPSDTVRVVVRVDDGPEPVPSAFEPKMVVRINSRDVPVRWSRVDNVWEASLGPSDQPGPWVVHVEARDPHDNLIGEAFVEVSGPPQRTASVRP